MLPLQPREWREKWRQLVADRQPIEEPRSVGKEEPSMGVTYADLGKDMRELIAMADAAAAVAELPKTASSGLDKDLKAFNALFEWAGTQVFEREDELDCIKLALLTKEHALFHGIHGVSKSDLAFCVLYNIKCKSFFEAQLTQFDGLEVLFGPVDIEVLKKEGYYKHNTRDCLPEAELAVLEEIFDANGPVLRSTLQTLNERKFTRGRFKAMNCPLWTVVGTTNFSGEDKEKLAAVSDRFLLRSMVSCMEEKDNRKRMYRLKRDGHAVLQDHEKLDFAVVKRLHAIVNRVELPDIVLEAYDDLLHDFNGIMSTKPEHPYITDRRARKVLKIIQAHAVMDGRTRASFGDVEEGARYGFCQLHRTKDEDEYSKSAAKIVKVFSEKEAIYTKYEKVHTLVDEELALAAKASSSKESIDSFIRLRKIIKAIETHFASQQGSKFPEIEAKFRADLDRVKPVFSEVNNKLTPEQIKSCLAVKGGG